MSFIVHDDDVTVILLGERFRHVGRSSPLGATVFQDGVNFSLFSRRASGVELLFFDREEDARPARVISIDSAANRTYHYWHVFVPGVQAGAALRLPRPGSIRSLERVAVRLQRRCSSIRMGAASSFPRITAAMRRARDGDNAATAMKSVVVDPQTYDWEGDTPLQRPASRTIIYEMHVRGFTRDPSSGLAERTRGTYAGLIEKIPYLQQLGITAVELMPVFQLRCSGCSARAQSTTGDTRRSRSLRRTRATARVRIRWVRFDEFRDMVKALHRAGIEVILDVVFNHTAEGDHTGPTLSFRGLDNSTYYILQDDRSRYANYSGTGNTLNANHPIVRRMIVDSLRYWVEAMHVDGFRFDLASILGRDESGNLMPTPPVLWDIESDPALAGTKIIAEAWDAAGLYQVGSFIGDSWREWNGRFRDDVRSFFRGDERSVARLADRLLGSPQIYGHKEREAEAERELRHVSRWVHAQRPRLLRPQAQRGEWRRQPRWRERQPERNWGVEGPTDDPAIERLRNRQVKNFLTATMLSLGLPMISMGDEVRRTQRGNNNAYCQDNEISWFDWTLVEKHADVHRFVRLLTARRLLRDVEPERQRLSLNQLLRTASKAWHGVKQGQPDWSDSSHSLAFCARGTTRQAVRLRDPQCVLGAAGLRIAGGGHPQ